MLRATYEKVIEAVHKRSGKIKWTVVPIKLVTTIITIATGGSAGKEGPARRSARVFQRFFGPYRIGRQRQKDVVICGISAGFAAVFAHTYRRSHVR
jgi:H+/Cl- antiporter ClcA